VKRWGCDPTETTIVVTTVVVTTPKPPFCSAFWG